ncbi:MAG TPA: ATP-binding protein [Acidobacteriaceae bacterium]|nr:ATP-binding protein [Acidobacteriaceae bacterium]
MAESKHRRATVIFLGLGTLFMVLLLVVLNAFKLNFLEPHDLVQIQLFTALSVLVFLLLVVLLVLLFRNILKHLADQRSRALGSRLRSRMLIGALLISCAPALFMVLFSYWLLNRSIDRWFTQPVSELRENSTRIALDLANYVSLNARAEAASLASAEDFMHSFQASDVSSMLAEIRTHRTTLQGGFTVVYRDGAPLTQYQLPTPTQPVTVRPWLNDGADTAPLPLEPLPATVLREALRSDEPILTVNGTQYALGDAALPGGGLVVMGLPLPAGLSATALQIRTEANQYWALYRERRSIRTTYLLLLLLLTVLVFFSSSWLALYLSKQITRPVEALADAMDQIGEGRYGTRITVNATAELGEVIRSFNHMAGDLEQSRALAETSEAQLSAANSSLEARRKELETVLETIPSSVVTLDHEGRILQANRAFLRLAGAPRYSTLSGLPLDSIFPPEISAELALLERRAQRMGIAATEIEMPNGSQALHLSATIALLELGDDRHGSILVIEDITEFLRAQRQVAWKQVAQRVAHEIKNPLTPILLSAERIRRHMDNSRPESPGIIRRCTEVILSSVESMRELVDQFAALAEFPAARPKPTNLNTIVAGALMLFHGRLQGVRIEKHLAEDLPPVMVDPQAMQRALANLIDNAAEAMQSSLLRVLSIETGVSENRAMAEVVLSDTGHGLTDEMRERLFLPYVSTKQRGTGLGLSIAAKIVQEHHGAIRAEVNSPAGARFIIELPFASNDHKSAEVSGEGESSEQEAESA